MQVIHAAGVSPRISGLAYAKSARTLASDRDIEPIGVGIEFEADLVAVTDNTCRPGFAPSRESTSGAKIDDVAGGVGPA
jgi:hypothetical protein